MHPHFNAITLENNIAIVYLKKSIESVKMGRIGDRGLPFGTDISVYGWKGKIGPKSEVSVRYLESKPLCGYNQYWCGKFTRGNPHVVCAISNEEKCYVSRAHETGKGPLSEG